MNKILELYKEISPAWLLTGEGPMRKGDRGQAEDFISKDQAPAYATGTGDYCYIPLYDVRAAAGGGAVVDREQIVDFLSFKSEWIRVQLHAAPQDLYLIHVEGESMEPTLRPGDVILVDHRAAGSLPRDGIYVLRMDDTLLVKRLQRLPGGVIEVTSDNPAYKPFSINTQTMAQENMDIIGRVVWCGRRM